MAPPEPTLRLFVALWPDEAVQAALRARRDRIAWPAGARPTTTERLHLTLHFLGGVPASRRAALEAALAVPCEAFAFTLDRLGAWPGGLVVLEAGVPAPAALLSLHASLGAALQGLGLRVERRTFCPHVTLARHCPAGLPLPAIEPLRWPVEGHAVVQSTPAGYRVLRHYRCT